MRKYDKLKTLIVTFILPHINSKHKARVYTVRFLIKETWLFFSVITQKVL